jgi:probable phosphoglycerate mutase
MTKFYLARHGQDLDNAAGILNGHRDQPLTTLGIQQADELAKMIKAAGIQFDKVYSSPLQRARKTAQIITASLMLDPPEVMKLLTERNFGMLSGRMTSEIEALCAPNILKTDTITYFLSPKGAETFPELLERAGVLLDMLQIKHPNQTLLLVTHGDLGKMLYAAFYHLEWLEVLKLFHFGNSELLLLADGTEPDQRHIFGIPQFNL